MRTKWPLLLLLLLSVWLFVANYQPNTFLSGWDTLHPEFNLGNYISRAWQGAWQFHQGLGSAASQAHAAELTRLPVVVLLAHFLPMSVVRYVFFFLTWTLGALGMYLFVLRGLFPGKPERSSSIGAGLLAAVFYLFNLVTVQHFYLPLEMFAVSFASLPWIFLASFDYLSTGKRRSLFGLAVVGALSAPQAHTPTLWFVVFIALGLSVLGNWVWSTSRKRFQRGVVVLGVFLLVNLFWLGPSIYYALLHGQEVVDSAIHHLFSRSAFMRSREYGTLSALSQLQNYLFSWEMYDFSTNSFRPVFSAWQNHLNSSLVTWLMGAVWMVAVGGLGLAFKRKTKWAVGVAGIFLMTLFFWINQNPPFTEVYARLREVSPMFVGEALRFPFTKFSLLLIFCLSVFLAFFHEVFLSFLSRFRQVAGWMKTCYVFIFMAIHLIVVAPVFEGHFISPAMKVSIPQAYFQLFAWFENQPHDQRVLQLPLTSRWGWDYYTWGYQGAGFTWFGIPQPMLNREFDRWNNLNETAFLQLQQLLERALTDPDNTDLAQSVINALQKYKVYYVLFDRSVTIPMEDLELNSSKMSAWFEKHGFDKAYNQDFLTVYQAPRSTMVDNYQAVSAPTAYTLRDVIWEKEGNYFTTPLGILPGHLPTIYPFTNFDPRARNGAVLTRKPDGIEVTFDTALTDMYELSIPDLLTYDRWPVEVWARLLDGQTTEVSLRSRLPGLTVNSEKVIEPQLLEVSSSLSSNQQADYVFVNDLDFSLAELTEKPTFLGYLPVRLTAVFQVSLASTQSRTSEGVYTRLLDAAEMQFPEVETIAHLPILSGQTTMTWFFLREPVDQLNRFSQEAAYNCDVFGRGEVQTRTTDIERVFWASDNAVNCDYITYSYLAGFDTLVLSLAGENRMGEGMRVFVRDYDDLASNFEEVLYGSYVMTRLVFMPRQMGAVVSTHTKAYGSIASENSLMHVDVLPFPFGWISGITLKPIHPQAKTDFHRVVTNNQAFENGWMAFVGGVKLAHVQVNGWENGWILPSDCTSSCQVRVFYWPNWLEWVGVGGLLVLLWYLARKQP